MSYTLLVLIFGSACCAIIGAVLTVVRATRYIHKQRARENDLEVQVMLEERKVRKKMEAAQE